MRHCPACNCMLPDNADQCTFCWEKLQPEVYGVPVPQSKPIPKRILVLFFAAIVSVIYWWSFCRQAPPPEEAHVDLQVLGAPAAPAP